MIGQVVTYEQFFEALLDTGFRFDFAQLDACLRHQLGRIDDAAVARAIAAFG